MKNIFRKRFKKAISVILTICLAALNPMVTYAQVNASVSVQQLEDVLSATQEMVSYLEEMGFTLEDIGNLFELSGQVDEDSLQMLYNVAELESVDSRALYDYDGNPPANNNEQMQRLCNVYSVALNNPSNYYEGSKKKEDFGDYVVYLYISHYIDGPGRAPTANDLPYIISSSDINAYNTFLNSSNLSSLFSGIASLLSACYSDFDYIRTIYNLDNINNVLQDKIGMIYVAGNGAYDIDSTMRALDVIREKVLWYCNNYYSSGVNEQELQENAMRYVEKELSALDFYSDYDENFASSLTSIMISVIWSVVTGTLSIFGLLFAALPLFVYSFSGLVQTAVLVNLGYSFSGRYSIRTGIYLGI